MSDPQQPPGGRRGWFGPGLRQIWSANIEREIKIPLLVERIMRKHGVELVIIAYFATLIVGKTAIPVIAAVLALIAGRSLTWSAKVPRHLAIVQTMIFVLVASVVGGLAAENIWRFTFGGAVSALLATFLHLLDPLLSLHWMWMLLAAAAWVAVAVRLEWIAATVLLAAAACAYTWYSLDARDWQLIFDAAQRAKWLFLPPLVPVVFAKLLLLMAMVKEQLAPALEFSLLPMTLEEYRKAGGFIGLWRSLRKPKQDHINVTTSEPLLIPVDVVRRLPKPGEPVSVRTVFVRPAVPLRDGMYGFFRALLMDPPKAGFSEQGGKVTRGAVSFEGRKDQGYGYTQDEWSALRAAFVQVGLARPNVGNQPARLKDEGYRAMSFFVIRRYGIDAIPDKWRWLLEDSSTVR